MARRARRAARGWGAVIARQRLSAGTRGVFGALPAGKRVTITLLIERGAGVCSAAVRFAHDGERARDIPMTWTGLEAELELWLCETPPIAEGLYFYDFALTVGVFDPDTPHRTTVVLGGER